MCGIIYSRDDNEVGIRVKNLFDNQKERGTDGFGILEVLSDAKVEHNKIKVSRFVCEKDTIDYLTKSKAKEILFHHRIPTSTRNSVKTNHPIIASNNVYKHNYYLIHNGIINNCEMLKKGHEELGINYTTIEGDKFNDSESLLHELALVIEGYKKESEYDIRGSLAFIMLQTDRETSELKNLFFGRSGNPLSLFELGESVTIRSLGSQNVQPDRLFNYDYKTGKITNREMEFSKYNAYNFSSRSINRLDSKGYMFIVSDIYEGKHVEYQDLLELNKEELYVLLVIARRVLRKMGLANELSKLRDGEEKYSFDKYNVENTVDSIKSRLKYVE